MEYEKSDRTGFQEREEVDFYGDLHLRQENRGVMIYALFDGEEQVSPEFGAIQDDALIWFSRGYSKAMEDIND